VIKAGNYRAVFWPCSLWVTCVIQIFIWIQAIWHSPTCLLSTCINGKAVS